MNRQISNKIINRLRVNICNIRSNVDKFIFHLYCKIQGIHVGHNLKLYGIPYTTRYNNGQITIGNNCTFRSRPTSNFIGLNHKCILSATPHCSKSTAVLRIGNNCGFSGVSIWCFKEINIGNNVRVGANSVIMDGDAHHDDPRTSPPQTITIEDDVFIGANCVIKKGVNIGKGAMIGMNSVVTKDIPSYSVSVGCPAKVIRYHQQDKK